MLAPLTLRMNVPWLQGTGQGRMFSDIRCSEVVGTTGISQACAHEMRGQSVMTSALVFVLVFERAGFPGSVSTDSSTLSGRC